MENIDNMAGNSLEALSRDNLTNSGKKKLRREIISGAAAISCVIVGLIYSAIFPTRTTVPALLYTAGFLIEGIPVFFASVKGIVTKNLTNAMEILVAIAIISCFFSGDLILAVLIPLILNAAHFLEERSIMGGRDVIDGLKKMQQSTATVIENGVERTVDVKTLKVGQKIVVLPGAGIPIDGVIVSGTTNIDQKSLTGEPLPFHAASGDPVYAGTVNIDGRIIVEVRREFVDTSFSKILSLLEKSENISIPESRLIDRFMRYYIPFVLSVAAAVALITRDITKAIAILVVSCPCGQMLVSSADGATVRFGKREWISGFCDIRDGFGDNAGGSVSYVEKNGRLLGYLSFGDTVRENAADSIKELNALGITETVMLTGDREAPARAICEAVGIDTLYAQLLPQDKYDHMRELKKDHRVLAVGDGINDALALREADVGISMGAMGSDLAIQSSDIALMNNNLENIPFAMRLARRTRKTIYQNLALSIGISACMIGLSAFGVISALAGSILHNCGAFAVLINSSRILRTR